MRIILPLEQRFPAWDASPNARGARRPASSASAARSTPWCRRCAGEVALNEAAERMTRDRRTRAPLPGRAHRVHGRLGPASSMTAFPKPELAHRLFVSFGIDASRITLEDKSRDTLENARFTRELIKPKPTERWLLVTSAHHMPRSVGLFREEGFTVEAYPGRLPHARRGRHAASVRDARRRPAPHRHRDARVGRAACLLDHRTHRGSVSRTLIGAAKTPQNAHPVTDARQGSELRISTCSAVNSCKSRVPASRFRIIFGYASVCVDVAPRLVTWFRFLRRPISDSIACLFFVI